MTKQLLLIMFYLTILVGTLGAWLTHVVTCIQDKEWLMLIAGVILPPVGTIHGWGIWLGLW